MTVDQKVLLDSIVDSSEVEATEDGTAIRRKTAIPTDLPLQKKVKTENEQAIDEIRNLNP